MPLILENAPTVQFRQIAGLFIASFDRPSFLEEVIDTTQRVVQEVIGTTEKTTGKKKTTGKATGKSAVLLERLRLHPKTTISELAELIGLTEDGVNYHLRKLQKDGLLLRAGGRKSGHWEVLVPVSDSAEAGRAGV